MSAQKNPEQVLAGLLVNVQKASDDCAVIKKMLEADTAGTVVLEASTVKSLFVQYQVMANVVYAAAAHEGTAVVKDLFSKIYDALAQLKKEATDLMGDNRLTQDTRMLLTAVGQIKLQTPDEHKLAVQSRLRVVTSRMGHNKERAAMFDEADRVSATVFRSASSKSQTETLRSGIAVTAF